MNSTTESLLLSKSLLAASQTQLPTKVFSGRLIQCWTRSIKDGAWGENPNNKSLKWKDHWILEPQGCGRRSHDFPSSRKLKKKSTKGENVLSCSVARFVVVCSGVCTQSVVKSCAWEGWCETIVVSYSQKGGILFI